MDVKPKLSKKSVVLPLIGIAAFFLYIYLFNVDIFSIIQTVQKASPLPYAVAVMVSFVEVLFYSLSWKGILSSLDVKLSLLKSYLFVWYGMFMDILIPAESVSGEICRIYLVNREQCGTSGKVVASLVTYRLLSMIANTVFLLLGAILLFGSPGINQIVFRVIEFLVVAIAILMIILMSVSLKNTWSIRVVRRSWFER